MQQEEDKVPKSTYWLNLGPKLYFTDILPKQPLTHNN